MYFLLLCIKKNTHIFVCNLQNINLPIMRFYLSAAIMLLISNYSSGWIITGPYEVKKLGREINSTDSDEISPVICNESRKLYFTKVGDGNFNRTFMEGEIDLSKTLSEKDYFSKLKDFFRSRNEDTLIDNFIESSYNQDIWITNLDAPKSKPIHPGYPLNNAFPNSACAYNRTNNSLIVVNQYHADGSISPGISETFLSSNGEWTFPKPINICNLNNLRSEMSVDMSANAEYILLSLERKDSKGDMDLYISFRINEAIWSTPVNLGEQINSAFRESTPFLLDDNKTLLFSSNRSGKSHDIYYTYRLDDTWHNWATPCKLDTPINSDSNESHPYLCSKTGELYFSSDRDGSMDIFKVKFFASEEEILSEKGIKCNIIDGSTGRPTSGYMYYSPSPLGVYERSFHLYDGTLNIVVHQKSKFRLKASKPGYSVAEATLDPTDYYTNNKSFSNITLTIYPDNHNEQVVQKTDARESRINNTNLIDASTKHENLSTLSEELVYNESVLSVKDNEIQLGDIYFERGRDIIRKISYPELNKLVQFLKLNSKVRIEIAGHTDNVGDMSALYKLSMQRSEAIKKYLLNNGVHSSRIQTVAMGSSQPLNDNKDELERSKNRRVQIFIL